MKPAIILLSGGVDSTVLLAELTNAYPERQHVAIAVDYGQRHRRELWSAFQLAHYYGARFLDFKVSPEVLSGSSLTDGSGQMAGSDTIVPGRNLFLIALAVAEAVRCGANLVYVAAHGGDSAVYPDCRDDFFEPLCQATRAAYGVTIVAPYLQKSKGEVIALGRHLAGSFTMEVTVKRKHGKSPAQAITELRAQIARLRTAQTTSGA